jgi:hypothetical protein
MIRVEFGVELKRLTDEISQWEPSSKMLKKVKKKVRHRIGYTGNGL